MVVLGLIPARGGSKGIPRKNIRPLAGKSLLQRAVEVATASGRVDRLIVSTDDRSIADAARSFGAEVPFLRPAPLAADDSPMIDVAVHALTLLQGAGFHPDILLLLQPSSPLRRPDHIRSALDLLQDNDAVCSVLALPEGISPHYVMKIDQDGFLQHFMPDGALYTRRQDVPRAYKRDGTIFLTRVPVILEQRSFYGRKCVPMILRPEEVLNLDDLNDWDHAERRLAGMGGSAW